MAVLSGMKEKLINSSFSIARGIAVLSGIKQKLVINSSSILGTLECCLESNKSL
jgi:hypothetical protein